MKLSTISAVREIRHAHMFCGIGVGARGFNLAAPRAADSSYSHAFIGATFRLWLDAERNRTPPAVPSEASGEGLWDQRYRRLEEGEIILSADEVQNDDGSWKPAVCTGQQAPDPAYTSHRVYRRIKRNPAETRGAWIEDAAWDWLEDEYSNFELGFTPHDRNYSADEMAAAFAAGSAALSRRSDPPEPVAGDAPAVPSGEG